jgi:hypothetical protein
MVRFIFACMAFVVLSLAFTPMFFGIKNTKDELATSQQLAQQQKDINPSLSFEKIYEIAGAGTEPTNSEIVDPDALNSIAPAAGDKAVETPQKDQFSFGFSNEALSTLAE